MNLDGTPCGCPHCNPDEATLAELDRRWREALAVVGRTPTVDTYALVMLQLVMDLFQAHGEGDDDGIGRTEALMATVLSTMLTEAESSREKRRRQRSSRMN